MLELEKTELETNLGKLQNRLAEIKLKTEKLQPIADSLTDLIEAIPATGNGQLNSEPSQTQNGKETNRIENSQNKQDVYPKIQESKEPQKKMMEAGESLFDELFGADSSDSTNPEIGIIHSGVSTEDTKKSPEGDNEVKGKEESFGKRFAINAEMNNETQTAKDNLLPVTSETIAEISTGKIKTEIPDKFQKKIPQDFDRADFYSHYPHLKGVQQTVPTLARNLLAYFNYGLKLSEITRLILALGHKHHSQNFTNSVHSSLKQKQAATRDFFFNPTERVWELAHWSKSGESGYEPQRAGEGKSNEGEKTASHNDAANNRGMARKLTAEFNQTLQAKNSQPNDKKTQPVGKQIRVIKKSR